MQNAYLSVDEIIFCTFYVVLGIWLYLRRGVSDARAMIMLTAGSVWCIIRRWSWQRISRLYDLWVCHYRKEWRRVAVSWVICVDLMMATWVGWANG